MTTKPPSSASDWDKFWAAEESPEAAASISAHNRLTPYWHNLLSHYFESQPGPLRMVDLGCGTGGLSVMVGELTQTRTLEMNIIAIDYAPKAVAIAEQSEHVTLACVADASAPPLAEGSIDLIVSQYGLEYAGLDALKQCFDLLSPHGATHLICHAQTSAIAEECGRNSNALSVVLDTQILETTRSVFQVMGKGSAPTAADRQSIQDGSTALGNLLRTEGADIAGGLPGRLYQDLSGLFARPQNFSAQDIVPWCDQTSDQIHAYKARMDAMTAAALSEDEVESIISHWKDQGGSAAADRVHDGDAFIGWHLSARRA